MGKYKIVFSDIFIWVIKTEKAFILNSKKKPMEFKKNEQCKIISNLIGYPKYFKG